MILHLFIVFENFCDVFLCFLCQSQNFLCVSLKPTKSFFLIEKAESFLDFEFFYFHKKQDINYMFLISDDKITYVKKYKYLYLKKLLIIL